MAFKTYKAPKSSTRGFTPASRSSGTGGSRWGEAQDVENRQAKEALAIEGEENKQRELDMVTRAVYGGNSAEDLQGALKSSTTGYSDPGVAKFAKNPVPASVLIKKMGEKPPTPPRSRAAGYDATDEKIAFAETWRPGDVDADGNLIEGRQVIREALKRPGRAKMNDPRWDKLEEKFKPPPPAPSWVDKLKSVASKAGSRTSKLFSRATDAMAPSPAEAGPTPKLKPNESREFTEGSALPNPGKFKEGSILKADGKPTHRLQGGQWAPIR